MQRREPEGESRFDFKNITQVFKNAVAPFNGTDALIGTTYIVLVETIVESIVRRLVSKKQSMNDIFLALTLGKPFEGMFYFGAEPLPPGQQDYGDAALSGAQTAPGQFVGQYLVSTFYKGFRMPGFDIVDMALTVGSKAASRPVLKFLDDILPDDLTLKADVINTILQRQRAHGLNSLLSDDKGGK